MCLPVGAAIALSALTSAGQFVVQRNAAQAVARHQQSVFEANQQLAAENANQQQGALLDRAVQENAATVDALDTIVRESLLASGSARAAAGASGVAGLSVDSLLADFRAQELGQQENVIRSNEFVNAQIGRQLEAVRAQQAGNTLGSLPPPLQIPSLVGGLFQVGSSAINTALATNAFS